jgi:heme O synthase-like polyprenyltransferase
MKRLADITAWLGAAVIVVFALALLGLMPDWAHVILNALGIVYLTTCLYTALSERRSK